MFLVPPLDNLRMYLGQFVEMLIVNGVDSPRRVWMTRTEHIRHETVHEQQQDAHNMQEDKQTLNVSLDNKDNRDDR